MKTRLVPASVRAVLWFIVIAAVLCWVAAVEAKLMDFTPPSQGGGPPVHVLAVAGLRTPEGLENPEGARQVFEPLILQQLEAAGYRVIPPAEFDPVWKAVADSVRRAAKASRPDETGEASTSLLRVRKLDPWGHVRQPKPEDPVTALKTGMGLSRTSSEIPWVVRQISLQRIGADAVVEPALVDAWDYSITIVVTDAEDSLLLCGTGRIEDSVKMTFATRMMPGPTINGIVTSTFTSEPAGFKTVKREKLFRNEKRNLHAVRRALTPFAAHEGGKN